MNHQGSANCTRQKKNRETSAFNTGSDGAQALALTLASANQQLTVQILP